VPDTLKRGLTLIKYGRIALHNSRQTLFAGKSDIIGGGTVCADNASDKVYLRARALLGHSDYVV